MARTIYFEYKDNDDVNEAERGRSVKLTVSIVDGDAEAKRTGPHIRREFVLSGGKPQLFRYPVSQMSISEAEEWLTFADLDDWDTWFEVTGIDPELVEKDFT